MSLRPGYIKLPKSPKRKPPKPSGPPVTRASRSGRELPMTDTPPQIAGLVRQKLMARSNEERFLMGLQSFEAARAMVLASLPAGLPPAELKRMLFQRIYGYPLPSDFFAAQGAALRAETGESMVPP
jgi:hypothetical protein